MLEWNRFRMLLPLGINLEDMAELDYGKTIGNVTALLQGYTVLRTDRNGWIELTTDGESMWVEVEK